MRTRNATITNNISPLRYKLEKQDKIVHLKKAKIKKRMQYAGFEIDALM